MEGIKFFMKDGSKQFYDPIDFGNDFKENELSYLVNIANYEYEIKKNEVIKHELYDICEKCGYEIKNGECTKTSCS